MFRVEIRDFNGEIYKTWQQDGFYVTGCTIEGNQINLERVSAATEGLAEAGAEQILYSDEIAESQNSVETAVTEELETIVRIFPEKSGGQQKGQNPHARARFCSRAAGEVALEKAEHPERYYVLWQKRGGGYPFLAGKGGRNWLMKIWEPQRPRTAVMC